MLSNSTRGRHKKRSSVKRRTLAGSFIAGAVVAAPLALNAAPASAAGGSVWDRVAACESGGNWQINTGNGFYGGLQFTSSTWLGYGGGAYASRADLASRDQQIAIAQKVLAGQGPGAWPVCSIKGGLTSGNGGSSSNVPSGSSSSSDSSSSSSSEASSSQSSQREQSSQRSNRSYDRTQSSQPSTTYNRPSHQTGDGVAEYVVKSGDSLSKIAARSDVKGGWHALWERNVNRVSNPNLIYVGQHLDVH